ncbi:MAG: hypothetical protein HZC47_06995 [Methanobacterium sp.]|uniref:hypothetical protein n=1 Tax=Methanobacterium sp. TaxID=2164 RepID=UPI003D6492BA|nr:hypothetical protein [Methanobacterium sp.]
MDSRKSGKVFIVLIISLIAFGLGSCVNAINAGNDITFGLLPTTLSLDNEQQMKVIDDTSFNPVHVMRHFYNNTTVTNTTPVVNNVSNSTAKKTVTNGTK